MAAPRVWERAHQRSGSGTDDTCRASVDIAPGRTGSVGCYKRQVESATGFSPQIADVRWQER